MRIIIHKQQRGMIHSGNLRALAVVVFCLNAHISTLTADGIKTCVH